MASERATGVLISCLGYKDAGAGVDWLCKAFGFRPHAVYRDDAGNVVHAELVYGNSMIMVGPDNAGEFGQAVMTMPERAGGRCTQTIYMIVEDPVDAHYERALAEGATAIIAPRDESYGGRGYSVRDPEGHAWSFGTYDPWQTTV
jgi:uncharacterized glyoxalase superfamily protein PhnB